MAIQLEDRIYTDCPTIGKADIEIGATKEGYQGWESITDGNTVYYCITDDTAWEVGYGVKTGTEIVRNLLSSSTGSLLSLDGNASVFCTYPSEKAVFLNLDGNIEIPNSNVNANALVGKGSGITEINAEANNLAPEAPEDGETYARNNKTWVSISESAGIPDAPVDGLMYGRQDGEWNPVASAGDYYTKPETNTLLDAKADKSTTYTKAEVDSSQSAQDTKINANTDAIAALPTPVDTYTKTEIDAQQELQDNAIDANTGNISTNTGNISTNTSNISSNTTAIGTLSGQVAQNSEDIGELQDSIFFTSAYSADYPSAPNRDPEDGNMYLQNVALFTYSYAEATQIFVSKTDESGNVRQFTAVQAGDSIVLNQVESPNYGRYELVSIEDVSGSYVVMNVIPKLGEGTVITGVKIAFQAFPKPATVDSYSKAESDAINDAQDVNISANTTAITTKVGEAPEDGKQYARKDANWTEVTGGGTLDIDALPALPTELEGTDLFVTERTGTNYKVTADGLSIEGTPPTYATWNPLDNNGAVLSLADLTSKMTSNENVSATMRPTSGKWYWENTFPASNGAYTGLKDADSSATGYTIDAVGVNTVGNIYYNNADTGKDGLPSFTTGDVIGYAWDADAKKLWWSKNGQWYTGDASAEVAIDISEVVAGNFGYDYSVNFTNAKPYVGSSGATTLTANFGQLAFTYPMPTGFKTLSTEG